MGCESDVGLGIGNDNAHFDLWKHINLIYVNAHI